MYIFIAAFCIIGTFSIYSVEASQASKVALLPAENLYAPVTIIPFKGGYYRVFERNNGVLVEEYDKTLTLKIV